jgi:hypothetical protein
MSPICLSDKTTFPILLIAVSYLNDLSDFFFQMAIPKDCIEEEPKSEH